MVEQPIWQSCQLAILGRQWVFIQTECSDYFSNYGGTLFFYCMGNFQSRKKNRSFQGTTFTFFFFYWIFQKYQDLMVLIQALTTRLNKIYLPKQIQKHVDCYCIVVIGYVNASAKRFPHLMALASLIFLHPQNLQSHNAVWCDISSQGLPTPLWSYYLFLHLHCDNTNRGFCVLQLKTFAQAQWKLSFV